MKHLFRALEEMRWRNAISGSEWEQGNPMALNCGPLAPGRGEMVFGGGRAAAPPLQRHKIFPLDYYWR